jgi:hypothetical protein
LIFASLQKTHFDCCVWLSVYTLLFGLVALSGHGHSHGSGGHGHGHRHGHAPSVQHTATDFAHSQPRDRDQGHHDDDDIGGGDGAGPATAEGRQRRNSVEIMMAETYDDDAQHRGWDGTVTGPGTDVPDKQPVFVAQGVIIWHHITCKICNTDFRKFGGACSCVRVLNPCVGLLHLPDFGGAQSGHTVGPRSGWGQCARPASRGADVRVSSRGSTGSLALTTRTASLSPSLRAHAHTYAHTCTRTHRMHTPHAHAACLPPD